MIQAKRNACKQLVRMSNCKINEIRTGENESSKHKQKKEDICKLLESQGKSYITEAIFKTGGRADILVLDDFKVIEVVQTESMKSIEAKKESYPKGLTIEVVKCH